MQITPNKIAIAKSTCVTPPSLSVYDAILYESMIATPNISAIKYIMCFFAILSSS